MSGVHAVLVYLTRSFPVPSQKHGLQMRQSCYKAPPTVSQLELQRDGLKGTGMGCLHVRSGLGEAD